VQGPFKDAISALGIKPTTPHDLRHMVATGLSALRAPRLIVSKVLNHKDRSVTAIYDRHRYLEEMREGLQKWAVHLEELEPKHAKKVKRVIVKSGVQ